MVSVLSVVKIEFGFFYYFRSPHSWFNGHVPNKNPVRISLQRAQYDQWSTTDRSAIILVSPFDGDKSDATQLAVTRIAL